MPGQRTLESDASLPAVDDSGDQLLRHARIYTLADKFGVDALKSLASSKIHCVNSTAKGEITYARYVYSHTSADDATVRAPIASFWATRSHMLRSEAEAEFKSLCLEYPQFGYDVLSRAIPLPRHATPLLTARASPSARPGREAQEGAQRQDAPCHDEQPQARAPQQRRRRLDPSTARLSSCARQPSPASLRRVDRVVVSFSRLGRTRGRWPCLNHVPGGALPLHGELQEQSTWIGSPAAVW